MLGTTEDDLLLGLGLAKADLDGPLIEPRQFRTALGAFATGVTVITALSREGRPFGVTVNSFASLSLDPPLVLWSLASHSTSFTAFTEVRRFAIHVLCEGQEDLGRQFARSGIDRFNGLVLDKGIDGTPLLPSVAAVFECRNLYRYWGGDHAIFIGRVDRFEHWPDRKPLVFHEGRMKRLEEK